MPQLEHPEYDLFFSYSHRDGQVVGALEEVFTEKDFSVFRDRWHMPEKPEDEWDWDKIIAAGLSRSKAGVIFFSPHSVKSKWVRHESVRLTNKSALSPSFAVVSVRLRPCKIQPYLEDHPKFDLFDHSPGALATAADEILSVLARESPHWAALLALKARQRAAKKAVEEAEEAARQAEEAAKEAAEAERARREAEESHIPTGWLPEVDEEAADSVSVAYADLYLYREYPHFESDYVPYELGTDKCEVYFSLSRVPRPGWKKAFAGEMERRGYSVRWNYSPEGEKSLTVGDVPFDGPQPKVKQCVLDAGAAAVIANGGSAGE